MVFKVELSDFWGLSYCAAIHPIQNMDSRNALLELRGVLVQSFEAFLQEPEIQKKYGVPIDALSRISFLGPDPAVNPRSAWIPIPNTEDEARPSGITNEEFKGFIDRITELFNVRDLYGTDFHQAVTSIFHEAFFTPVVNRPFRSGTYVRFSYGSGESEFSKSQNVPCEVCGENRVIDACHIIPRRAKGAGHADNTLFLCPTHHRLLDACMLSKEEWGTIDWTRKNADAQKFAEEVIKVAHARFWKKVDAGIYRRQSTWEAHYDEEAEEKDSNSEE